MPEPDTDFTARTPANRTTAGSALRIEIQWVLQNPGAYRSLIALSAAGAGASRKRLGLYCPPPPPRARSLPIGGSISIGALTTATMAGLWAASMLSERICGPYPGARGVSHDEELACMVAGLAPIALIALIGQMIT